MIHPLHSSTSNLFLCINKIAFKKGICLFFALSVDAVVAISKPVNHLFRNIF